MIRAGSRALGSGLDTAVDRFSNSGRLRLRVNHCGRIVVAVLVDPVVSGAKRLADVFVAVFMLVLGSPALLVAACRAAMLRRPLIHSTEYIGRWCVPFQGFTLEGWPNPLAVLPLFWNILKGDMSLIGPRPVLSGQLIPRDPVTRRRYDVRPGLICLWWIRSRSNIGYEGEAWADAEYVDSHSLKGDAGIMLRAVPAALYGSRVLEAPESVDILGIRVANLTMGEALDWILAMTNQQEPKQICFLNADCGNLAVRSEPYLRAMQDADLVLADGIGLKIAGRILKMPIRQNVNGTDLFPRLCEALAGQRQGIFLLGARPGIAEAVGNWVETHYPGVRIAGVQHGYFSAAEEDAIIERIAHSGASILLVAFGAPKQDMWIRKNLHRMAVPVAMGVGGLFDFYSGRIPRAPIWVREAGFEWLYRFYQEPGRMWKRYFVGNVLFLLRVSRQKRLAARSVGNTDETKGVS